MKFRTEDNLEIAYDVHGEGHPILCLPGLTRNASDFDEFVEAYKGKAKIITVTYRGREPSDFDPDWKSYNVFREGKDCVALLDELGVDKALWLGTSRGGLITMAMAAEHKSRMAGAVLNDIGPELNADGLASIMGYLGIAPAFLSLDEAAISLQARMGEAFPTLDFNDWRKLASRYYRFDENGVHLRYDPKLRDAVLEGRTDYDLWAAFHELDDIPLGVIWGENSDLLDGNGVLKMKEARLDLEVAKVPDRGHVPFLNEPEAIALIDKIMAKALW